MRKLFLHFSKKLDFYWPVKYGNLNKDLTNLWFSFDWSNDWIQIDDEEDGWVTIWSKWEIKYQKMKQFVSFTETKKYDDAYSKYWLKRWEEIPKLHITKENHEQVLKAWKKALDKKDPYLIIAIDDFGWVHIETKDALSEQDWQDLQKEHQIYLDFNKKYEAYKPFLRGKKNPWESPADDEYYSDFLTKEEMVWKKI